MALLKKCIAEFIGTFVLVLFGCGTAVAVGCNGAKAVALREFFLSNREKIGGLVSSGCKYAAYLNERTQQILQMERSKEWAKVEKIDCLRGKYL